MRKKKRSLCQVHAGHVELVSSKSPTLYAMCMSHVFFSSIVLVMSLLSFSTRNVSSSLGLCAQIRIRNDHLEHFADKLKMLHERKKVPLRYLKQGSATILAVRASVSVSLAQHWRARLS